MLNHFLLMADLQATQLIYLLTGILLRKFHLMKDELRSGLSSLMLNLFLPCMILDSFSQTFTARQLWGAAGLLMVSVGMCVVSFCVGRLVFGRLPRERSTILRYGTLIPNASFVGQALMRDVYGQTGAFLSAVYVIPLRVCLWSAGVALFSREKEPHRLRKIFANPCMVVMYIGFLRMLLQFPVPAFIDRAIGSMGECCSSISMIFVGSVLADTRVRGMFCRDNFLFCLVRLIVMPGITLLLMRGMSFGPEMTTTAVVLMSMPISAATTTVLAERYNADASFAAQCSLLSTLLSLCTIPVWAALAGA